MPSLHLLLFCSFFVLYLADVPAIHEKEITVRVKSGGPLSLKIPVPTNIWHREFKDNRPAQYIEACNPYLDVCQKWRSDSFSKHVHPIKVLIAENGTLYMPKVTPADSAVYYTYYPKGGIYQYSYFNVIVA